MKRQDAGKSVGPVAGYRRQSLLGRKLGEFFVELERDRNGVYQQGIGMATNYRGGHAVELNGSV